MPDEGLEDEGVVRVLGDRGELLRSARPALRTALFRDSASNCLKDSAAIAASRASPDAMIVAIARTSSSAGSGTMPRAANSRIWGEATPCSICERRSPSGTFSATVELNSRRGPGGDQLFRAASIT